MDLTRFSVTDSIVALVGGDYLVILTKDFYSLRVIHTG